MLGELQKNLFCLSQAVYKILSFTYCIAPGIIVVIFTFTVFMEVNCNLYPNLQEEGTVIVYNYSAWIGKLLLTPCYLLPERNINL